MKKSSVIAVVICLLCLSLYGCAGSAHTGENGKIIVAAAIVPEAAFIREIVGDKAEIITAIPAGSSPESYEPTPSERVALSNADIYFSIGVPAEATGILPVLTGKTRVVRLDEAVSAAYPDLTVADGRDSHIWLSPKRVKVIVAAIRDELCAFDPDNADDYEKNADGFIDLLGQTENYIKEVFNDVSDKDFIVFHPSFSYFADDFGLRMYALEEEGREATPRHLAEMVDFAKQKGIKAVYYQGEVDGRQARAFAENIGGQAVELEPLSGDYINNLKFIADTLAGNMKK